MMHGQISRLVLVFSNSVRLLKMIAEFISTTCRWGSWREIEAQLRIRLTF
jgi:hypothetical protein